MKVAIDFDGTCAKLTTVISRLVNYREGTDVHYTDVENWDWWWEQDLGDAFMESLDLIDDLHLRRLMDPYDGHVTQVLHRLLVDYDYVHPVIVTSNQMKAWRDIKDWFIQQDEGLRDLDVWTLGRGSPGSKLGLDEFSYYADDSPKLVEYQQKVDSDDVVWLADAPWNRYIDEGELDNVYRWSSWKELESLIYNEVELHGGDGTCRVT